MIFDGWFGILRVLVVGPLAYVCLVLLLRVLRDGVFLDAALRTQRLTRGSLSVLKA